ncbi:MAG: 2-oxoglutarate dehydrogenase complex dihydrolipoyllysine-residue succinyltransferase [Phycisphaerae bacterium]|nr:2-oxoglutarate dehydrogenase complex dihydrolipoyllysine-residue succinyltransferase [Phycisphaerae bacterium]
MQDIVVPPVAESVSSGVIARWNKGEGQFAAVDDVIFEFETDKVTIEVRAEVAGVVAKHLVPAGETVQVGQVVGRLDEAAKAESAPTAAPAQKTQAAGKAESAVAVAPPPAPPKPEARHAPEPKPAPADVKATPLARKMAEEHQVDLSRIVGTGPAGRVREQDVIAFMQSKPNGAVAAAPAPAAKAEAAPPRGVRVERMSPLRQRVAQRLVEAQHTAAMLTTFNECDMSGVMALRARFKEEFEKKHGVGLGFMGFFVKAVTAALQAAPKVNAFIVSDASGSPGVEFHDYCDVAVAVSTPKGLVVPVIRSADRMSLAEVELAIKDLATRARDGKLTLDEIQGGTFTISNGGVFGSLMGTPILNPPQSAILGMHVIRNRPVEDPQSPGQIALRPMMYLALSYDHRMLDGADAVQFLIAVKRAIEDPSRLLLGI